MGSNEDKTFSILFTLTWKPFGPQEWMAWAGAEDDAHVAYVDDGVWIRSTSEGECVIEFYPHPDVDDSGMPTKIFTIAKG